MFCGHYYRYLELFYEFRKIIQGQFCEKLKRIGKTRNTSLFVVLMLVINEVF
jgi:hypothetical protein